MDDAKQLTDSIFRDYQTDPVPIENWFRKTAGEILIAKNGSSNPRGFLLYFKNKRYTRIWLCGVVQQFRHSGIMKTLLKSMLNDENCQDVISVHINREKFPEMYAFMHGLGFVLTGNVSGKDLERFEITKNNLLKVL